MQELVQASVNGPSSANTVTAVADPRRFGRLLEARRRELGMTQGDVREAGGPSDLTIRKLEKGVTSRPDLNTLAKLDQALGWVAGSAARTLNGGWPESLSQAGGTRGRSIALPDDPSVTLRTDVLADLIERTQPLSGIAKRLQDDELTETVTSINVVVDRVFRAWITNQLEQWKAEGTLQQQEVFVQRMLGEHLARDPATDDPDDAEELAYIRWLLGRGDELTAEQAEQFETRWRV